MTLQGRAPLAEPALSSMMRRRLGIVVAVVVIWVHGIESPAAPSLSAPPVEALKVTLPLLLTMAAVSTPPVRSPPTPATAVLLPTVPAAGEKVMASMVPTDDRVGVAPVYVEPVPTRKYKIFGITIEKSTCAVAVSAVVPV